jgi:hypothetical protein
MQIDRLADNFVVCPSSKSFPPKCTWASVKPDIRWCSWARFESELKWARPFESTFDWWSLKSERSISSNHGEAAGIDFLCPFRDPSRKIPIAEVVPEKPRDSDFVTTWAGRLFPWQIRDWNDFGLRCSYVDSENNNLRQPHQKLSFSTQPIPKCSRSGQVFRTTPSCSIQRFCHPVSSTDPLDVFSSIQDLSIRQWITRSWEIAISNEVSKNTIA